MLKLNKVYPEPEISKSEISSATTTTQVEPFNKPRLSLKNLPSFSNLKFTKKNNGYFNGKYQIIVNDEFDSISSFMSFLLVMIQVLILIVIFYISLQLNVINKKDMYYSEDIKQLDKYNKHLCLINRIITGITLAKISLYLITMGIEYYRHSHRSESHRIKKSLVADAVAAFSKKIKLRRGNVSV